jgi:phosphatidylinositol glycan class K
MEGINKTSQMSMKDIVSPDLFDKKHFTDHSQFNSYDPAKINSHPGVRSDLFKRPLDKTLITDFFGGVAQAEVNPPTEEHIIDELGNEPQGGPANYYPSPVEPQSSSSFDPLLIASRTDDTSSLRTIRLWIGLVLVVGLATWVFRQPPPQKQLS